MKITPKNAKKYECKLCDFICSKQSDYDRHMLTSKHKNRTKLNNFTPKNATHICVCGKEYSARNSLWYHKKKCLFLTQDSHDEGPHDEGNPDDEGHVDSIQQYNSGNADYKQMFIESMKQNQELQKAFITQQQQISELIPKVGNTTNHTTNNTTNHNNQFNLNFFLNEQCKDAIPLIDFVKSLQYDFDQLEYTGKHGFVEGVSKIIMDAMNELDITKRPIHCTDVKRETFYVKDDESWKKEDDRNRSIKTAIHNIRNRNLACVPEWIRAHPNCKKIDDPNNDLFIEIIGQYMDAAEKEFVKVIKTIAKSLTIPKSKYGRKHCIIE